MIALMVVLQSVPKPLLFNPLKHHLGFIQEYIKYRYQDVSYLKNDLLSIGNSQMDVYGGELSAVWIYEEILNHINDRILDSKSNFIKQLHENKGYLLVTVSDKSGWILREGIEPQRFIHLHPARYSPHTFRINANTLKSLIAANAISRNPVGLNEINLARDQILGLDPVSKIYCDQGMGKYLKLFSS